MPGSPRPQPSPTGTDWICSDSPPAPARRRTRDPAAPAFALAAALWAPGAAAAAAAADVGGRLLRLVNANVSDKAAGALAMLGMTLAPSETSSLNPGSGEGMGYQVCQFGGAFTISEGFPLCLEGYSRYDPVFVFSDETAQSRLPTNWTSVGASGGVGWDFRLSDKLAPRPVFNVALGHVESAPRLLGRIVSRKLDVDLDFLKDGSMTAGGVGASPMLDHADDQPNDEIDVEVRCTRLYLQPVLGSKAIDASSAAATSGMWSRLRAPTGINLFSGPLRAVCELSGSLPPGDQGEAPDTGWLAQIGTGMAFDMSKTWVPVSRARVTTRYTQGEELTGFSIGIAASV